MTALQQTSGTVTSTRKNALRINGGPWLVVSQYADPKPLIPAVGMEVAVGIDAKGFVYSVAIDRPGPVGPAPTHEPIARPEAPPSSPSPTIRTQAPPRDTIITRLSCIKTAAGYLADKPDAKAADVIKLAACFETWVNRS